MDTSCIKVRGKAILTNTTTTPFNHFCVSWCAAGTFGHLVASSLGEILVPGEGANK